MNIVDLFDGLDRCAPGDAENLRRACDGLSQSAHVLDAGCGRGADLPTLLALVPKGRITAVDLAEPFIRTIRARYPHVRAEVADMTNPPGGPFDLIWSGGAIYGPGVRTALTAWRGRLAPGGRVIFTELLTKTETVVSEVRTFFAEEGVPLRGELGLRVEVEAVGWRMVDGFWLPASAWEAYYLPLEARMAVLEAVPEMGDVIAAFRREIAIWRRHGADYGYFLATVVPA